MKSTSNSLNLSADFFVGVLLKQFFLANKFRIKNGLVMASTPSVIWHQIGKRGSSEPDTRQLQHLASVLMMAASLRLKPFSAKMASLFLRFQTKELSILDYSLDRKIRWETRFDSANRKPLQVTWYRRIKTTISIYINN